MNIYTQISPRERLKIALEKCNEVLSESNLSPAARAEWTLRKENAEKGLKGIEAAQKTSADLSTTLGRNQAMMNLISSRSTHAA